MNGACICTKVTSTLDGVTYRLQARDAKGVAVYCGAHEKTRAEKRLAQLQRWYNPARRADLAR